MTPHASIVQLNLSGGGVPKLSVAEAYVGELGLAGDAHNDKLHHGGPERAVCLFAIERIEALAAEGHHVAPGTTGENVTVRGLDWDTVVSGTRVRLGSKCLLEVTGYASPCATIEHNFSDRDFMRMSQKVHQGWSRVYTKVLVAGMIKAGDPVEVDLADPG